MKCSLLTLSTFIDGELAPQRTAEVDAHLVGCTRCSSGAATLREEKSRIGQLARVSVDPASAQLMLEQVGIAVDPFAERPPAMSPPQVALVDEHRPWQGGTSSSALPWTPHRPEAPAIPGDLQAELPLEGVRSVPPSWNRPGADLPTTLPSAAAAIVPASPPAPNQAPVTEWDAGEDGWPSSDATADSWEAELPPADGVAPPVGPDASPPPLPPPDAAAPPVELLAQPLDSPPTIEPPPPPPAAPAHAGPPTRVVAASGPAALWARIHDAVTVRLALARSGEAVEDSAHIVSGAPLRRGAQLPSSPPATREVPDEVELSGVAGTPRAPSPPVAQAPGAAEPADWNAFAGSSYPDVPVEPEREPRPRPLGRHSRAVAREQVPLSTRLGRALTAAAAAVRAGATTASAQVRAGVGRMSRGGPDNRLLAGIAGIGLIFVVALLIGRSPSRPATPATRAAPASTAPQAHQSGPPQPSAAASTAGAATPPQVQTFGAGDTGFQVIRLRYGAQKTSLRVVFDMGAAGTAAAGTPKVTLSFSTPTTLLVTIDGTLPAGSTGTPPPGKVISSVTLVSTTGHKTVYRFALTRAATATAFYLTAPTRFVLDIH